MAGGLLRQPLGEPVLGLGQRGEDRRLGEARLQVLAGLGVGLLGVLRHAGGVEDDHRARRRVVEAHGRLEQAVEADAVVVLQRVTEEVQHVAGPGLRGVLAALRLLVPVADDRVEEGIARDATLDQPLDQTIAPVVVAARTTQEHEIAHESLRFPSNRINGRLPPYGVGIQAW